jgi:MFS family permease
MLVSEMVRAVAVAAIAALAASGQIQLWHVQALAVIIGSINPFLEPARMAMVPQLVPRDDLLPANSLASTSRFLAQIFGPLLGATVVAVGGMAAAFAFHAIMLSASALCIMAISPAPPALPRDGLKFGKVSVWTDLREGFRTVLSATWLWFGIGIWSFIGALSQGSVMVVLPQFVRERLVGDVAALGAMQSAAAIGMVAGTIVMGQITMPRQRGVLYYLAATARGLLLVALGFVLDLPAAVGLFLVYGAMLGVIVVIWNLSLQELVPHHLQGRVRSIDMLGSFGLNPIGFAAAGIMAESLGPSAVFIIAGIMAAVFSAGSLLVPGNRRFEN